MSNEEAIKILNRLIYSDYISKLEIQAIDYAIKTIKKNEEKEINNEQI